jgi:hypothetical protein
VGQLVLRFESPEKNLGLLKPSTPHKAQVGAWHLYETIKPHPHNDFRQKEIGGYRVVMERLVATQNEARQGLEGSYKLAQELDVAWCYAWGKPLIHVVQGLTLSEAPSPWSGNLVEVEMAIQRQAGGFIVVAQQGLWREYAWWPSLPLERALITRQACLNARPIVRDLIELHIRSHKSVDGSLFLLAKALEIVGAFFWKGSRASRNAGIEHEMKKVGVHPALTQSIDWLFDIANKRFDVRHAWDKDSPGVVLHPRMTTQERDDFTRNADIVIRAFICERLGIGVPMLSVNDGEPSESERVPIPLE